MRFMTLRMALVAIALVLIVASCGSGDSVSSATSPGDTADDAVIETWSATGDRIEVRITGPSQVVTGEYAEYEISVTSPQVELLTDKSTRFAGTGISMGPSGLPDGSFFGPPLGEACTPSSATTLTYSGTVRVLFPGPGIQVFEYSTNSVNSCNEKDAVVVRGEVAVEGGSPVSCGRVESRDRLISGGEGLRQFSSC